MVVKKKKTQKHLENYFQEKKKLAIDTFLKMLCMQLICCI